MSRKYPGCDNITEHKHKVWQMLLLMFKDTKNFSEKDVENALRCLAGDASLWVYNAYPEKQNDEYLERARTIISHLRVTIG